MPGFSRLRRCDTGCPVDMVPLWAPPPAPDRWVRLPAVGWWVSWVPPGTGERAGGTAFRCPRCGQTARLVAEVAAVATA